MGAARANASRWRKAADLVTKAAAAESPAAATGEQRVGGAVALFGEPVAQE